MIKQMLMLEDPLIVFQISIIQTLFISQLETTHKGGSNQIINY
jgi:hypothetical protein